MSGGAIGLVLTLLAAAGAAVALWFRRALAREYDRGRTRERSETAVQRDSARRKGEHAEAKAQAAHELRLESSARRRAVAEARPQTIEDDESELREAREGPTGEGVAEQIEGRRRR